MTLNRQQFEPIDILKLYTKGSHVGWNEFLEKCRLTNDVNKLVRVMKSLQIGMDDLAKKQLNVAKVDVFFIRLVRSIEKTLQLIYRQLHPHVCDNPMLAKDNMHLVSSKRQRDREFEAWLTRVRF